MTRTANQGAWIFQFLFLRLLHVVQTNNVFGFSECMNASVSEIVNFGDVQQLLSSSDIHATGNRLRQLLAPPGFVQQLVLRLLPMAASVLPTELQALWTLNCLPAEFLEHLHLHEAPDTTVNSTFRLGLGAQVKSRRTSFLPSPLIFWS